MKYHELTEEQREHFDYLINTHGVIPEGATHFTTNDDTTSSWLSIQEDGTIFFWGNEDGYSWKLWDLWEIFDGFIVEIPEKPWTMPADKEDYISTPEEEEALMKIAESTVAEEDEKIACDLCIAIHIQKLQEFMKESGTKLELVIHKDFIAINDNGDEYRPKEGGVGTLIDYVHTRGKLDSIAEKLEV